MSKLARVLFVMVMILSLVGLPKPTPAAELADTPLECASAGLPTAKTFLAVRGQPTKQTHDSAILDIGADALEVDTSISMTPLCQEALALLDQGMTNVTKAARRGYRFLPHMRFKNKIKISLPYDKALIPAGLSEQDIKTFYFDEQLGTWHELERVAIDTRAQMIISLSDHFTDMINATVTVPDHPQTLSFNPTSIKDIKAADPGAGINLVEAPGVTPVGDARLSYPIEIPPGRRGMQPQLGVMYNSSAGNGWLGLGWDLQLPTISIDTRWGVPRYDASLETETYVLNGEQLTPVAHRGEFLPRTAEKTFHTRVEGQFQKIIRHGSQPANYWWEVIDKSGTRSFYGGTPEDSGPIADATLTDERSNIFRWALRETRDLNGNAVRYSYERRTDVGLSAGTVPGVQLYPKTINYTRFNSTPGAYTITFVRDSELPGYTRRADVQVDGRGGFKQVTAELLKRIEVSFQNSLVRRYELNYRQGSFEKTLLASVTQYGEDGAAFHTHTFEYYQDLENQNGAYQGFEAARSWNTGDDGVTAGLLGYGQASALSGAVTDSVGGHLYAGFNPATPTKQGSFGAKGGYTYSTSNGVLAMIDLNGDDLPDKVFKSGSGFAVRLNRSGPSGTTVFGPVQTLPTLRAISQERSDTVSAGGEVYVAANIFVNRATTFTTGEVYFNDVNGDGLPDLVSNGEVFFNHLDAAGTPTFTANSNHTEVPIGAGVVDGTDLLPDYEAVYQQRLDAAPLHDTIRRWVAPYTGRVRIGGPVALIRDTSAERGQYRTADGVRVAIQQNGSELWSARIQATDYAPKNPTGVDSIAVNAGDRLYFRVQSILDGAYDQVAWNPAITYLNVPTAADVNGLDPYQYEAAADFVLAGRTGIHVQMPITGTLQLTGDLLKRAVTTDDVTLQVVKNGAAILSHTFAWDDTGTFPLNQQIPVLKDDAIKLRIRVDSPIDLQQLDWTPELFYTSLADGQPVTDASGNPLFQLNPPYDIDLYPESDLTAPQQSWTATQTGTLTVVPQLASGAADANGSVTLTVKRPGALLGKQTISVVNGVAQAAQLSVAVEQGDTLYFTYSTAQPDLASKLASATVAVVYGDPASDPTIAVPSALFSATQAGLYAQDYRGWTYVGYNGNRGRATQPIDESLLVLDVEDARQNGYDPAKATAYAFSPFPKEAAWRGPDTLTWVTADTISSSRLGADAIDVPRAEQFAGGRAVSRLSQNSQTAVGGGVSFVSGSASTGDSGGEVDYLDLNGDRFPDIVANGRVQYTTPTGGLEARGRTSPGLSLARDSAESAQNIGVGGSPAMFKGDARGEVNTSGQASPRGNTTGSQMVPLGLSGSLGRGESDTQTDLLDINGDGLPDRLSRQGATLMVALNLGYRFAPAEPWGAGLLNDGSSQNGSIGASLGYNAGIYDYAGGISLTKNSSKTRQTLLDINGDGLLDRVRLSDTSLRVALNTGAGFADEVLWGGALPQGIASSSAVGLGGGLYFTIGIGPLCLVACYLILNPGADYSQSMARQETMLRDVDGDGYTDHLFSTSDGALTVARNRTDRTNLLKTVRRPLGATITLAYQRDGNTTDLPSSRWVLSQVAVDDGHAGDGVDVQLTSYRYEQGRYSRLERDFFGYRTVIEEHRNTAQSSAVYRSIVREFRNDTLYTKGLLERERTLDSAGRPFLEKERTYRLLDIATGEQLTNLASTTATVFPQLIRTDERFFEGLPSAQKSRYTTYQYDALGNMTAFFESGDSGTQDDLAATIGYVSCPETYLVGTANTITVTGNGSVMRRREATIDCATGDETQVRELLADGSAAVTDLAYFENGNLRELLGPTNHRGQRYQLSYTYDAAVQTHVTQVTDSFGYRSTATHNLKYGALFSTADINNNQTSYRYDVFGRVTEITGPYQQGGDATIRFEYHPEAAVPWAQTRHADVFRSPTDTIDTVLFTDGLKRPLQTKKDGAVYTGVDTAPQDVMQVSGRATFDFVGRVVEQFHPVTEPLGTPGVFNATYDQVRPTRTTYDILNRKTQITFPDATTTSTTFGFGADRDGATQFQTTVVDANGKQRKLYQNLRELTTGIQEFNTLANGTRQVIWTSYTYDALSQLAMVEDDQGHRTRLTYDNLGRRTVLENPDTGRTETVYDLASNTIAKITANLRAEQKQISYSYDFNRLARISYPNFVGNTISYSYGAPGATENRAGRITVVTDESGVEERFYGKLGEITKEIKTIASATQGASDDAPEIYTTTYRYDTFGRLQSLTYPDGELLTYRYDSGGMVRQAVGVKAGLTYDYLRRLEYDKFGQRVFVEAGNNVRTQLSYNPETRRLEQLKAGRGAGNLFQNLSYRYDGVGNILNLTNDVPVPRASEFGGPTSQSYSYDDLYRLTGAAGAYQVSPEKTHRYSLSLAYDTIHNTTAKRQSYEIVQPSTTPILQQKTSYNWTYAYNGPRPHAVTNLDSRTFSYDANGNQTGWTHDLNGTRRIVVWDEENRIQSLFENGHEHTYAYDDSGERIIKRGPQGETAYVNQYLTIRNREIGTKHVYAGTTRVVSKLLKQDKPSSNPSGSNPREKDLYFYHGDHLGSSNYVTDANGQIYQHLEYFPSGEAWIEDSTNIQRTPYRFTAKELDEETGLYYFGARYYDPRVGQFISGDPLLDRNPRQWSSDPRLLNAYAYGNNNPTRYVDPDGETPWDLVDVAFWVWSVRDFVREPSLANGGALVLDTVSLLPVVPSAGWVTRGGKIVSQGADTARMTNRSADATTTTNRVTDAGTSASNAARQPAVLRTRTGYGGRVELVQTRIGPQNLGGGTPTNQASRDLARSLGRSTDDAGHVAGRGLGGGLERNIVPQNPNINRGAYNKFEQEVANYVRNTGHTVDVTIQPIYRTATDTRPIGITYSVTRNGVPVLPSRSFLNP